jgi:hypothetical protein
MSGPAYESLNGRRQRFVEADRGEAKPEGLFGRQSERGDGQDRRAGGNRMPELKLVSEELTRVLARAQEIAAATPGGSPLEERFAA